MCIIMDGEVRGSQTVKGKKGEIEILQVLVKIGKRERIEDVANFSQSSIDRGNVRISVVPRSVVSNGRAYLNWATFDGVVK